MGERCDEFRSIEDAFLADSRQTCFVVVERESGEARRRTFEDHHAEVAALALQDDVPEPVRIAFDSARNILLYSWCAYRLHEPAELQALAASELALRLRLEVPAQSTMAMHALLERAVREGCLEADDFEFFTNPRKPPWPIRNEPLVPDEPENERAAGFLKRVTTLMRSQRNELAHGSEMLYPHGALVVMSVCRDLINGLFKC